MDFAPSARALEYRNRVAEFIAAEIAPVEQVYAKQKQLPPEQWTVPPVVEALKQKARDSGLWNLFLPSPFAEATGQGPGLNNVDYAPCAELMGQYALAPEIFNCNAPDTGNAEVLLHYGSATQKQRWLEPLLQGNIRSAFCMTEPDVASSDATNMTATAVLDGDDVVINGQKWFSTGIGHPNCAFVIVMALTDPEADRHRRHSMVLVPMHTPGMDVKRMLSVFGMHDAPYGHGEVHFQNVRVPAANIIAGPGRGFEIAQGRLGPGRIHHCMRLIGLAERALSLALERSTTRTAFGKPLANLGGNRERIAEARIAINQARLHVLHTAWLLDNHGASGALSELSQIKASVPRMAQNVVDMAIQLHGAGGLTDDLPLAEAYTAARSLRLADGPDEVHLGVVSRIELAKHRHSQEPQHHDAT
ncbi:acyl-CoA dehydrogenase family protein [Hoyosella rhizosphaerae]|uniref:Acyl-CoA dehydrogenase n=1 Tax=Hoyosella rhizosphaerae TaxID=1755582 RepID=A0A916UJF0_9ACTN|nr:acyl-CoA dehydrogenase family protein [Hoyosella rhizosphaerae]MBN4925370.1 acyl-CoA dehydrogenase family protein [Hoyosella rhizosphaerae]GGC75757.1 putative acyl-CoA dehydrogenase [Hoyosella rhizosphaerae]